MCLILCSSQTSGYRMLFCTGKNAFWICLVGHLGSRTASNFLNVEHNHKLRVRLLNSESSRCFFLHKRIPGRMLMWKWGRFFIRCLMSYWLEEALLWRPSGFEYIVVEMFSDIVKASLKGTGEFLKLIWFQGGWVLDCSLYHKLSLVGNNGFFSPRTSRAIIGGWFVN